MRDDDYPKVSGVVRWQASKSWELGEKLPPSLRSFGVPGTSCLRLCRAYDSERKAERGVEGLTRFTL
jgi:hypothetical protein